MAKFEAWSNVVVNDLSDDLISSVDVYYYLSSSSTSLSGGSWVSSPPDWVDGKYYWQKTVTTFKDDTTAESDPVCITGAKGATGATGTGIDSITEEYYLSTSKETPSGGSWVTEQPAWESGKYIWTRSKIVYKNPTSTEYTDPYCDTSWEAANDVRDELLEEITLMQTTLSGVETKVDANTKSITDKVWQKDITEAVNNYDNSTVSTLRDRVTLVEEDIDGIETTVSDIQTEVEKKADGKTVQTLTERVAKAEQDASGFKTTVEETYATKNELNNRVSTVKSEWTQRADEIESSVSDLEGNVSTNTQNVEGVTARVESAEGDISQLKISTEGLQVDVENAESNAKSFATQEAERIKTEVQNEIDGVESSFEQRADQIETRIDLKQDVSLISVRYIRDWLNGSDLSTSDDWIECKVIVGADNVASGLTPTSDTSITHPEYYTDNFLDGVISVDSGEHYLELDLGEIRRDIEYIHVWHDYSSGAAFNHKLEVSADKEIWYVLFDSSKQGTYEESEAGRMHYVNQSDYITGQFSSINQTIDNVNITVSNTSDELSDLIDAKNALSERLEDTENSITEITGTTLPNMKKELTDSISSVEVRVDSVETSVGTLQGDMVTMTNEIIDANGWRVIFGKIGVSGDDIVPAETSLSLSEDGVIVTGAADKGYQTVITGDEFAGYYDNGQEKIKIFFLDKDLVYTYRVKTEKGADFNTMKILPVQYVFASGTYGGLAFIPADGNS